MSSKLVEVKFADGRIVPINELPTVDFVELEDKQFHILANGKAYHASLLDIDRNKRMVTLLLDGQRFEIKIEDEYDQLVRSLGFDLSKKQAAGLLKSPMPGLVFDILKSEGDVVEEGDSILILEAMKMENVIKAPVAGTLESIFVEKGEAVEKNAKLFEIK